ncbi:substrate-binding domain-containing protein [Treponema brennaborense]|uniref:Periplasmic binding protein/LacI transcriptional regulator n=1 Tax=Treponema brennaborense (strain DSM 12168 / CIP 105900 / DD5/3) TaxID=906968 RepID=F4LMF3_TREBD|nr:substrate-binding domain-containing protein [Treponema brennaborense]AEE15715.1 periplasmic binding protein/LacI transcriptional regulator [Treponema brennaborense DSM 12168]
MKKAIVWGMVCIACLLSGCAKKGETDTDLIGFSISTQNNPFFVTLADGAKKQAATDNSTLAVVDAGDDVVKQISDIEDLISKNVKVLIVNPVDSAAVAPAVTAAKKAGIPVIAVDRAVIGETVACQIASDNVAGAKMAGEYLLSLVGEGAEIAELQGIPGASATIDRGKGFHLAVDGKAEVKASLTANFNRVEGLAVTENLLQSHGDLKGLFAHNDEMALGALEAAAAAGKQIVIVGFDATDDAVAAVKDGRLAATVAQQPAEMGKIAVQTAIKLIRGESVPESLPVVVSLITK